MKVKLTNTRYAPPYVLKYEKLIWGDILNLERDVVITLENKFNVRISGYNVYGYDKKIILIFDKFLKEKIGYKEMHSLYKFLRERTK